MAKQGKLRLGAPQSVNEVLTDQALRHQVFLQRFGTHEAEKIRGLLGRGVPDVRAKLHQRLAKMKTRGFDLGPDTTKRLTSMHSELNHILKDQFNGARKALQQDLKALASSEVKHQVRTFSQSVPIEADFLKPSPATLRSLVTSRPFDGHLLKDWFAGLEASIGTQIEKSVSIGMVQGEGIDKIVQRALGGARDAFAGDLTKATRQAEAVVRTAVNHVSSHARQETFKANEDVIASVRWVATLDDRTCPECGALDGKVFPVNGGRRPPAHMNCRCTPVPVVKSAKALGIKGLKEKKRGTRFARGIPGKTLDGKVPKDLTYPKWLKKQDKAFQNEVLGPGRGVRFRRGKLTLDQFTDFRGKPLTLDQLDALEAKAGV